MKRASSIYAEIVTLLANVGATGTKRRGTTTYRLPNGREFALDASQMASVHAARSKLASLRLLLKAAPQAEPEPIDQGEPPMEQPAKRSEALPTPEPATVMGRALQAALADPPAPPAPNTVAAAAATPQVAAPSAAPAPQVAPPPVAVPTLKDRIAAAIQEHELAQERLLKQAEEQEQVAQMLRTLLPYAESTHIEQSLRTVLKQPAPTPASGWRAYERPSARTVPPEADGQPVNRILVTREKVSQAVLTFDGEQFTLDKVIEHLSGGLELAKEERLRVRSSVNSCMVGLAERGEVVKEREGSGRIPAIWRAAKARTARARAH